MGVTRSAGVLLYRRRGDRVEVLLGHMGGPYWARKDDAAWSIPKGECQPGETDLEVARREFREEIGVDVPTDELVDLGDLEQSRHKVVHVWTGEGDLDADSAISITFEMEWPPRSGRLERFAEIDRAAWVDVDDARRLLVRGQVPLLTLLMDLLDHRNRNKAEAN